MAFPLTCSYAMSNRACAVVGADDQTWPMLFVTTHDGVHTYASSHPSSLSVTMIRVFASVGDHAIRTPRIGLPAVACSDSALQAVPSQVRIFALFTVLLPVFERYVKPACSTVLSKYPAHAT